MGKLFGTDGIRGEAGKYPLNVDFCIHLADALIKKFELSEGSLVIIGKDTRESGDMLEHALAAAFCSYGLNVELLGIVPTPSVSILTPQLHADIGIMISASHNPFRDNGIKIFNSQGLKLLDADEDEIENYIFQESVLKNLKNFGGVYQNFSAIDFYKEKILNAFHFEKNKIEKLKIVLDCANGSFSKIAPEIFKKFGFEIFKIAVDPSGKNINEKCGVTYPKNLSEKVLEQKADFGIAFDGDGDRVIFCDENGEILDGDYILAALVESKKIARGSEVISTIMSNYGFEKYLGVKGIKLVRTKVGDRYISEYMRNSNAIIGGEPSGHIILREHALTGDGLFTALKIVQYISDENKKCSELRKIFNLFPNISENVHVKNKSVIFEKDICEKIEKFKMQLNGRGKLIVRPSGTEPLIRISAEGQEISELQEIVDTLIKEIKASEKL